MAVTSRGRSCSATIIRPNGKVRPSERRCQCHHRAQLSWESSNINHPRSPPSIYSFRGRPSLFRERLVILEPDHCTRRRRNRRTAAPTMTQLWKLLGAGALLLTSTASAELLTPKHEAGRCAIRGHCGKKSWFGKELPCVDNGLAEDPDDELRQQLVDLCGEKWAKGPVCCDAGQVSVLTESCFFDLGI